MVVFCVTRVPTWKCAVSVANLYYVLVVPMPSTTPHQQPDTRPMSISLNTATLFNNSGCRRSFLVTALPTRAPCRPPPAQLECSHSRKSLSINGGPFALGNWLALSLPLPRVHLSICLSPPCLSLCPFISLSATCGSTVHVGVCR